MVPGGTFRSAAALLAQRLKNGGNADLKIRQIFFDNVPDSLDINAEVIVHQNVAKAADSSSVHLRVFRPEVLRQAAAGFGKRLEISHNRILYKR